jgi:hypothetical protein
MRKIFILALTAAAITAFGQSEAEEAIILNQELQFLEESVRTVETVTVRARDEDRRNRALNEPTLERRYFGEAIEEDVVSTRTAGQRRRGL